MQFKINRESNFFIAMIMAVLAVVLGWGNIHDWGFQNLWFVIGLPVWLLFWLYSLVWGIRTPLLELQDDTIFIRRSPIWRPKKLKPMM